MKRAAVLASCAIALLASAASVHAAEAPATLTWNDLVNRPDRWPATVKVTKAMRFSGFDIPAGTSLAIDSVKRGEVMLVSPKDSLISVKPDGCDLLEAANAAWAKLTPEQRNLTPEAVAKDPTLWPGEAAPTSDAKFGAVTMPAGKPQRVARVNPNGDVSFYLPGKRGLWTVAMKDTDLFARARDRAAKPIDQRPGRIGALFAGTTIDAAGKPAEVRDADYFVYYVAASTCPRCEVFTPKLVAHQASAWANRSDIQVITTTSEGALPPYLQYAQKKEMPFPILRMEDKDAPTAFLPGRTVIEIPGLVVVDRFGNILASTTTMPGAPLEAAETLLSQLDAVLVPRAK